MRTLFLLLLICTSWAASAQHYGKFILEKGKKIEKSRIARELHDNIVSELYGLRMNAEISAIKKKNLNEVKDERKKKE